MRLGFVDGDPLDCRPIRKAWQYWSLTRWPGGNGWRWDLSYNPRFNAIISRNLLHALRWFPRAGIVIRCIAIFSFIYFSWWKLSDQSSNVLSTNHVCFRGQHVYCSTWRTTLYAFDGPMYNLPQGHGESAGSGHACAAIHTVFCLSMLS